MLSFLQGLSLARRITVRHLLPLLLAVLTLAPQTGITEAFNRSPPSPLLLDQADQ